jgi:choline transport protein
LAILIFFSFWPMKAEVYASTMNYAALVTGSVVLFSTAYYFLWARRKYIGPVIEVDVRSDGQPRS